MTLQLRWCTADGRGVPIYEAQPSRRPRGVIVVVHEIFGLTSHIRMVCERLAAEGYIALAPNLFAAAGQTQPLPYTAAGKTEELRIKNSLTEQRMAKELIALIGRGHWPFSRPQQSKAGSHEFAR